MESQATHLQAVLIGNNLQTTSRNIVWLDDIRVNRTGAFEPFLGNSCNLGYVVQCDTQYHPQTPPVPSTVSLLPIVLLIPIIIICLMLVFVIIYLRKKKRALERELEALKSSSENLKAFQDCSNDGDRP